MRGWTPALLLCAVLIPDSAAADIARWGKVIRDAGITPN